MFWALSLQIFAAQVSLCVIAVARYVHASRMPSKTTFVLHAPLKPKNLKALRVPCYWAQRPYPMGRLDYFEPYKKSYTTLV